MVGIEQRTNQATKRVSDRENGLRVRIRRLGGMACLVVLAISANGCNRSFYRQQADREVYCLQTQGAAAVGDAQACYPIQPGIESRMFDPNSPDCPPMPPDDPVSHRLMRCVDGKRGWRGWDRYGTTRYVENPHWDAYLPRDAQGNVVLDRTAAVQLALCNSREYQQQLENLYLSALEVTFQRFRFDAQFFGGNRTFFEAQGREIPGGSSQSILGTDTSLQMQKMFATGGELVVGVANSLVWQFAGPDEYSGITILDFSLFQPLLRAGGRAVVLEGLTDAERALVANIRQMERFQRGFYAQIVAGRNPGSGPSPGPITLTSLDPGGGGAVGGLMALLRQQVLIRNQRANVVALRDSYEQLKAFFNAERVDWFQVEQARLQHYQAQIRLLDLQNQYQNAMDAYNILLGLPPALETKVEDPLLTRFELIASDLTEAQNQVTTVLADLRDPQPGATLSVDIQPLGPIIAQCRLQIRSVAEDMERLDEALPTRRKHLLILAKRPEFKTGDADPGIVDVQNLDNRVAALKQDYTELCRKMELNFAELDRLAGLVGTDSETGKDDADTREELKDAVEMLSGQMVELSLCQARTRLDTITLTPLNLDPRVALDIARDNRRDWKNARAALVDQWRQIEVVANELESDLNVTFSGDLKTVGDRPVQFRGTSGRLRVGLEFDAPLTRLVERNRYRRALIEYQRARREYYAYEDQVYQALRRTLRAIQLAQINFEQRRAAVYIAATQVDLKQYDMLHKPPAVGGRGLGDTAARDVVDSINNLLNEQNSFLEVWVDCEVQRLNLAFDLGTMKLDNRGMWIDDASFEDDLRQSVPVMPEEIEPGILEEVLPPLDVPDPPIE
ncbi:MAG: TolC family protein [Pirellulaceae bacterium]|nr:TolC family protein [Pirellulaceae bacterium]